MTTKAMLKAEVTGEPLFAQITGVEAGTGETITVEATTNDFVNRRIACRQCSRKFLPYVLTGEVFTWTDSQGRERVRREVRLVADVFSECPGCGASDGRKHRGTPVHDGTKWVFDLIAGTGRWDADFTDLKVKLTAGACESICATATGGDCKCSCGGANHGVRA